MGNAWELKYTQEFNSLVPIKGVGVGVSNLEKLDIEADTNWFVGNIV